MAFRALADDAEVIVIVESVAVTVGCRLVHERSLNLQTPFFVTFVQTSMSFPIQTHCNSSAIIDAAISLGSSLT
jgi:hypothetical protein